MTNKAIQNSYQNYKKAFKKAMNQRMIRPGIELMTYSEYAVQYNLVDALVQEYHRKGVDISHSRLITDETYVTSDSVINGVIELLTEHGVEVDRKDVIRDAEPYFGLLKTFYPDKESFDLALSEASGW